MRSNLKQSNGLDALFKSTCQMFVWKCDLKLLNIYFRLSIWPNGHREAQKLVFVKWIHRTNEATGLIVLPPNSAQNQTLCSHARCLFGPGSTWTSSPKILPTPLILFGSSPPCTLHTGWIGIWRCTCRDWPFSSASKPIDLGLGFQVHWAHI